ncbi:hypothetical protein CVU37_07850 [candidate division BRC1 bacterium HGW-BRC1-1]|nr:MAG: hypothetical protein CVU37_07850 [candidate division BRC1 bacterium HGW-BRC1-1]
MLTPVEIRLQNLVEFEKRRNLFLIKFWRISLKTILVKRNHSPARGFTLIELLIVVAIIAILAAIAVPNFLEAQVRSKVSRVKADMRTLATAIESYTVDNNKPMPIFNGTFTEPWPPFQTRVENRVDRYHWLTSPVSYISSPIKDPFMTVAGSDPLNDVLIIWGYGITTPAGTMSGGWQSIIPAGGNFQTMFREQQWAQTMVPPGTLAQQQGALKPMWVAFSFGPDRIADRLAPWFSTNGIQDYDATNGTISHGDVIRHRE